MPKHRNPRPKVPKQLPPANRRAALPPPEFDHDGTLDVLRDNVGRAEAMVVAADELIVQLWSGESGSLGLTRRRNHVSYYLESARLALREAMDAGDELDVNRGAA